MLKKPTVLLASLAVVALLALVACQRTPAISTSDGGRTDNASVSLMAIAPDGTHLWRFNNPGGRDVYFASTGTQQTVNCGKNCTREETVPTASDPLSETVQP